MLKSRYFIFMMSVLLLSGVSSAQQAGKSTCLDPAPDFQLKDLSGGNVVLSDYKDNKAVILFFWTTSCPYCLKELKVLNAKYEGLSKEGVEVLTIDIGESPQRVEAFMKKNGIVHRMFLDRQADVAYQYGLMGVPTYIGINRSGNVCFTQHVFPESNYRSLL